MIKTNRKLIIFTMLAALCISAFSGCGSESPISHVEKAAGLDIGNASVVESTDSHDNFLGDGTLFISADCSNSPLTGQIKAAANKNSGVAQAPAHRYAGTAYDRLYRLLWSDVRTCIFFR